MFRIVRCLDAGTQVERDNKQIWMLVDSPFILILIRTADYRVRIETTLASGFDVRAAVKAIETSEEEFPDWKWFWW